MCSYPWDNPGITLDEGYFSWGSGFQMLLLHRPPSQQRRRDELLSQRRARPDTSPEDSRLTAGSAAAASALPVAVALAAAAAAAGGSEAEQPHSGWPWQPDSLPGLTPASAGPAAGSTRSKNLSKFSRE